MNQRTANDMDNHVAAKIKAARKAAGISQEALADKLGISFQQVQKYERGVNRVSAGRLFEIAMGLDKPVSWFFQKEAAL